MRQNMVTHGAIHHDPEGRCNNLLAKNADKLRTFFEDAFVISTISTEKHNPRGIELMKESGMQVIIRPTERRSRQLDTGSNIALVAGYTRGKGNILFLGCLDRTLHMLETYPEELRNLLESGLRGNDYIILGRTERALSTHPMVQLEPELYTNQITAKILKMPGIDVTTGCRLIGRETAKDLVKFQAENNIFTNRGVDISDSSWPYIVSEIFEKKVGFVATEGLEFETPDQYPKEITELGYSEWVKANFTEENKKTRWLRAYETERVLNEFSQRYGFEGKPKGPRGKESS
jgi:hypothetical protein